MKEKILPFIIGFLVGAIIATAGWFIYAKLNPNANPGNQMEQMQKPEGMGEGNMPSGNMMEPPTKPDGDNSTEPPAKPNENSSNETNKSTSNSTT